ncbi:acVLRF1 family peptidyl-tRNA hydrolase [uncultured Pseudokineococcus sp.]|uniref:acVLRF1 family peptidyl-tRNA hydrolase n=1 Tax=uncultured Pseudokineococcus sp. TaxID=1642928 RepID=UPI0026157B3E|nr:acVLRF1 family peptidyl-tRNA hydrolase [uncultured Pseudokineococcus sp.]
MPAARVPGWFTRFGEGHGGALAAEAASDGRVLVRAPDGSRALVSAVGLDLTGGATPGEEVDLAEVVPRATSPRTAAVLLLRRGGAVLGVVRVDQSGARVLDSLVRTAYVQSRTAAGGWSQQRYARRRAGQSAGLVRDAAAAAGRVWGPHRAALTEPEALLCTAGDRGLLDQAVVELPAGVAAVGGLPRQVLELRGDPRRRVLEDLAPQVGALHVAVSDP